MTLLSAFASFGSEGRPHRERPPARPHQCPATPRRANHPPAARPTLSSRDLPAVHHPRESASRARRRRVSGRPGGRPMFLEPPLHASIRNTRRPSLVPSNARAGRGPGDRRSVESAAPLRPSLHSRYGTAHAAVSFLLLPSRPRRISTSPPSRTAQRFSPVLLPAARMRDGWKIRRIVRWLASPILGGFGGFLAMSQVLEASQTRSVTARGGLRLQRRDSGAPASDSMNRTRSACRDRPCLENMCFTCERIVLSLRPVPANRVLCDSGDGVTVRRVLSEFQSNPGMQRLKWLRLRFPSCRSSKRPARYLESV